MLLGISTCKESLERMNDYLDRKLTPQEMKSVRQHVLICHACALKFASEAKILEETRAKMERIFPQDRMITRLSHILAEAVHDLAVK
jgi:hypothetical protein